MSSLAVTANGSDGSNGSGRGVSAKAVTGAVLAATAAGAVVRWYRDSLPLPTPLPRLPFIGHFGYWLLHPHQMPRRQHDDFERLGGKNTLWLTMFSKKTIFSRDPAVVRQFMTDPTHFEKGDGLRRVLRPFLGSGIFAVSGDEWRRQREAAAPLFHRHSLDQWVPVMENRAIDHLSRGLAATLGTLREREADSGSAATSTSAAQSSTSDPHVGVTGDVVEAQRFMREYTLATFLEMGIGITVTEEELKEFGVAFDYLNDQTNLRFVMDFLLSFPAPKFDAARELVYRIIDRAIDAKASRTVAPPLKGAPPLEQQQPTRSSSQSGPERTVKKCADADELAAKYAGSSARGSTLPGKPQGGGGGASDCGGEGGAEGERDEVDEAHPDVISQFAGLSGADRRQELRDVVLNFILAGRDTTASLLAHALWMIAIHPAVQDRIVEELVAHGLIDAEPGCATGQPQASSTEPPTATRSSPAADRAEEDEFLIERPADAAAEGEAEEEDGPSPTGSDTRITYSRMYKLDYLKDVLRETLRLYPSVPIDGYNSKEGAELVVEGATVKVPLNISVFYNSYSMHRREEFFGARPLEFDPMRWRTIRPPPFSYIPFHAGRRTCLGRELAYLEAKVFIVTLLRRFRVGVGPGTPRTMADAKILHTLILGHEALPVCLTAIPHRPEVGIRTSV